VFAFEGAEEGLQLMLFGGEGDEDGGEGGAGVEEVCVLF
jgi:hypothetical protein